MSSGLICVWSRDNFWARIVYVCLYKRNSIITLSNSNIFLRFLTENQTCTISLAIIFIGLLFTSALVMEITHMQEAISSTN